MNESKTKQSESQEVETIPYIAHEACMHRAHRVQCALICAMGVLGVLMACVCWIAVLGAR